MESITALTTDIVARLREAGCVFAEDEARLLTSEAETETGLETMVRQRTSGRPLEQVLGWAEFCGMRISLEPGVFVPRRRTELLTETALALACREAVVLELCCGSGAIGAVLAARSERIELHAADVDSAAVRCARRNLSGTEAHVYQGDLYEPLPASLRGRPNLLIANAPYVPSDAVTLMPREARDHEPQATLDGGEDGLAVLRRILAAAPDWLAESGQVVFELGESQIALATDFVLSSGLQPRVVRSQERDAIVMIGTHHVT